MKFLPLFLILAIQFSANSGSAVASNCNVNFKTYTAVQAFVEANSFYFTDKIDCSQSKTIKCAFYYSCDGVTGFTVLCTNNKKYICKKLPLQIWKKWKVATNLSGFYDKNIKHKYQLTLIK